MRRAIQLAQRNRRAPFAALLVDIATDNVLAEGINRAAENPVLHGEIDAINNYAASGDGRWTSLRLYTTAEPCCMCQAAIIWAGIPEVVFGTSIKTLVELGWNQFDMTAEGVAATGSFMPCKIIGGVLAPECDRLFATAR